MGSASSASPFGTTTSSTTGSSLFGGSQPASGGGLFGSTAASSSGGLFGKPGEAVKALVPSCFYTPLDQLTAEEKAKFESSEFELGLVPTRPPPKELCF